MNARKRQAWGLPWFRNHDGWWYVNIKGKLHKLAKGEENRESALAEWHRLMAISEAEAKQQSNPLWVIFEKFLERQEKNHPTSYTHYRRFCQSFKDRNPNLTVAELRVRHINEWLDEHPTWSDSTRHLAVAVILAALNWAAKPEQGYITRNPLRGMSRPAIRSRGAEAIMDEGDYLALYAAAKPPFRNALFFLRQTGTRPGNLARITAATIDAANRCLRLSKHKTADKTGKPLVIPLTEAALQLVLQLAEKYPEGPLFRGMQGQPMTARKLTLAFIKLKQKLELKGNPIAYGLRHTVATELLQKNMPDAKVAFVLGHKGTAMLYHHYGHLDAMSKSIAEELDRTLNGDGVSRASPQD